EWYQLVRFFQSVDGYTFTSFAYSTDGGTTWSDRIDLNPNLPMTTGNNGVPSTIGHAKIGIPLAGNLAGSDNVRIKFTFAGNFYFWGVDDISITKRDDYDVQVNENWYAKAPYTSIPQSQVEPMVFMADIQNIGGQTANGVELKMEVVKSGSTVYEETLPYGDLIPDSIAENEVFGNFTPQDIGAHVGTYTLSTDNNDANPDNNTLSFAWEVTDSVFAKENAATRQVRPALGNWDPGEPTTWTYGNHFYITNGDGYEVRTVSFIVNGGSDAAGRQIAINLWKWTPPAQQLDAWAAVQTVEDINNTNYDCMPEDREKIGYAFYEIQASDNLNQVKTVVLNDQQTLNEGVNLEDNTHYVLMLEYESPDDANAVNFGASEAIDYSPTVFASQLAHAPRLSSMLGISTALDTEPFSAAGFGRDIVVCVRMNVTEVDPSATIDILQNANITAYPSPAKESVTLDIDLGKNYEDVLLKVVDAGGTVLREKSYTHLENEKLTLQTSEWASGTYFVQIITAEGIKTAQIVIQQ
ncbi:MAG TPA: T9SS type A sorting domain-containing protein, partial [Phaeodactylibacter sp.]|nr:T9SS type A sorting domain-containing protein [Phaeodactylibacter sp.]